MKQRWLFFFTNGEFKEKRKRKRKGEKVVERFTWLWTVRMHLHSWKRNFRLLDISLFPCANHRFFSLLLLFPSFLNENQPFDPASLIPFFLPRKNLYPRLASLAVSSPLSVRWSSHFSFVARRKVHFSRVTCRQRYKGIFRASANIT